MIVHIEVQGYEDASMAERVFNIYYRIFDMYRQPPATLVIYTDNNSKFHPKSFCLESLGTTMELKFKTFKLLEHHPKSFPKKNRFSYVMETAWYDLKKNKTSDEKLLQQKKSILERMQADGFSSLDVYSFLKFIVHYTRFEKYEYLSKFEEHVNFIFKNNRDMSIIELEKFKIKELAKAEGKFEGIDLTFQVIKLLKDDLSIKVIAQKLNISETKVGDIKKQFEEHINFVLKNNRDTSIIELEALKREQLAKGKFEGIGLTLQVIKLLKDDLSIKVIAQKLNISEKEVEDIKKQFEGS